MEIPSTKHKTNLISWLSILMVLFFPNLLNGQLRNAAQKNNIQIGQEHLTIDVGLFHNNSHYTSLGPCQGFILGVERKRHRLITGPTFGKNIFFIEPNEVYGLTGFMMNYSFIILQPVKKFSMALSFQFQYNYQNRVVYYEPPSETLILSSKYQESFFYFLGLEPKVNIIKNLQIFGDMGMGLESRKTQAFYPYYPPKNNFDQKWWLSEYVMIGIVYGFPTKNKLAEQ